MLTISKPGYFNNSISYSRIRQVALEARGKASEQNQYQREVSYNPAMGLGEMFYDHVFCGDSKQDFMKSIYAMSHERARLELVTKYEVTHEVMTDEERRSFYLTRIAWQEEPVNTMLGGNSLQFDTEPFQDAQHRETYLIYRDHARRKTIGIPLNLQPGAAQNSPLTAIPAFDSVERIHFEDLNSIKKSGKLNFANRVYDVRFTDKNEPIVMQLEEDPQATLLQKRLLNLWAIENVKERLVQYQNSVEQPILDFYTGGIDVYPVTDQRNAQRRDWIRFCGTLQHRLTAAVNMLINQMKEEIIPIRKELESFENLINPTWADKKAFLKLQQKISLLEQSRDTAKNNIADIKWQTERFCNDRNRVQHSEARDLFKIRLLEWSNQMTQFLLSKMDEVETEKFKNLCANQSRVLGGFSAYFFELLTKPRQLASWQFPDMHPPLVHEQHNQLFAMLKDPASTLEQIEQTMQSMQVEQDQRFKLRITQANFGHERELCLNVALFNEAGHSISVRQGNFSPRYIENVAVLEKIRDDLLSPGNFFTQPELDALNQKAEEIEELQWREYRSRGFTLDQRPQILNVPFNNLAHDHFGS